MRLIINFLKASDRFLANKVSVYFFNLFVIFVSSFVNFIMFYCAGMTARHYILQEFCVLFRILPTVLFAAPCLLSVL